MRCVLISSLLAGLFAGSLSAAAITFQTSDLSSNQVRITYTVTDFVFALNQELDIEFDPALYLSLSNGVAPTGFDVLLLQPNNPPGTAGDFSSLALVASPGTGPFRVDATLAGSGRPGPQNFTINQLNDDGVITGVIASGQATAAVSAVPEPATLPLVGLALFAGPAWFAVRRRLKRTA
jgi:PEP-CTERM motif